MGREIIAEQDERISELYEEIRVYHASQEIRVYQSMGEHFTLLCDDYAVAYDSNASEIGVVYASRYTSNMLDFAIHRGRNFSGLGAYINRALSAEERGTNGSVAGDLEVSGYEAYSTLLDAESKWLVPILTEGVSVENWMIITRLLNQLRFDFEYYTKAVDMALSGDTLLHIALHSPEAGKLSHIGRYEFYEEMDAACDLYRLSIEGCEDC